MPGRRGRADELAVGAEDDRLVRTGWDDPRLAAEVDWDETNEWVRQGREKVRKRREEELRQLNEQARRQMEAGRAFRRARRAARNNGKNAGHAPQPEDENMTPTEEELRRMTTEALRSAIAPDPSGERPAALPESRAP